MTVTRGAVQPYKYQPVVVENGVRVPKGKAVKLWKFSVTVAGKQVKRSGFASKAEADTALANLRDDVINPKAPAAPTMTLAQAFDRYWSAKSGKRSLREDRRQAKWLVQHFGADTPIIELTAPKIAEYRDGRKAATSEYTGRQLTTATVNRPLALLRTMLNLANQEWGTLPSVPRIRLEKEPEGRVVWMEPQAEIALLAGARASGNADLHDLLVLAIETGMRQAEVMGLEWSSIDMTRGVISLAPARTKAARRREIPMRQAVYDLLSRRRQAAPSATHVFAHRSWNHFRSAFERVAAKITTSPDGAPLTFHGLRHHFASWFAMNGGSLPALQKILGHATLAMTMKYSHLSASHVREEMAKTERKAPAATTAVDTPSTKSSARA